jgi:predicted Zn-dependent peptidase
MKFRSNNFRTSDQIAEACEYSGIKTNAFTNPASTVLVFSLPPEKLDLAVEIAYQAISNFTYDEAEFTIEKNGPVTTELVMSERNPVQRFFVRVAMPRIYEGTPLKDAVIGTFESVRGLSIDDMIDLKRRFYVPNNMIVAAAGAVDPNQFFDVVRKYFSGMSSSAVEQPKIEWQFRPGVCQVKFDDLKDPGKPEQDNALVGLVYRCPGLQDPDSVAVELLNTMISDGFTSLLFKELRKERGIGYSPRGEYVSLLNNAVVTLGVPGLHPLRVSESIEVMQGILARLRKGEVSSEFVEGKKFQLISEIIDSFDSGKSRAGYWISERFSPSYYTDEQRIEAAKALSAKKITEVADRVFSREPIVFVASAPGYDIKL